MVPESVRWLIAQKKTHEAGVIIRKAAKINGKQLSDEIIQAFELKSADDQKVSRKKKDLSDDGLDGEDYQTWQTLKQFMSSRKLVTRFIILFFIW